MFEYVFDVFCVFCGYVFELALFTVVERVTKQLIAKACTTNNEKQAIWLLQCAALFFLCLVVNFHHRPNFLFAMACFALIYTIFLHKVDIRNYIRALMSTWQDSDEFYSFINSSQPQPNNTRANHGGQRPGPQNPANPRPLLPLPHAFHQNDTYQETVVPSSIPVAPTPVVRNTFTETSTDPFRSHSNTGAVSSGVGKSNSRANISSNSSLRRIPYLLGFKSMPDIRSWLPSKWVRDFTLPPGLLNGNQENLCFINCVLQTLSRSPQLVDGLRAAFTSGRTQHLAQAKFTFLQEVTNVFYRLTDPDEVSIEGQHLFNCPRLDTRALRTAIHPICYSDLVVDPSTGAPQPQQDASEFLLWILEALNQAVLVPKFPSQMSVYSRPAIHQPQPTPTASNSAQASLIRLKELLGYPSTELIAIHRQRCLAELANAHGQNDSSYANLVTMLSSLDWLLYKETNNSIVDDLFAGQQVSASCCLGCFHISVSTDVFRILTLPIPSGSDCVAIADCFWQLTKVENFTKLNRPKLESCSCALQNNFLNNANHPHLFRNASNFQTSTPNGPRDRRPVNLPYSPGMPAVSPIPAANMEPQTSTPMSWDDPLQFQPQAAVCQRQTSLQRLPECLAVQLLRFAYVDGQNIKVRTRVKVSLEQIDLSRLIIVRNTPLEPLFYSLYGICMHSNSTNTQSGHYFAYALANDGHWYLFNDSTVGRVEIEHELGKKEVQENVYLLYYRRISSVGQL